MPAFLSSAIGSLCTFIFFILFFAVPFEGSQLHSTPLSLSELEAEDIADKIWFNEGRKKRENLACWNKGEEFGSFGIGHFIWYPSGTPQSFEEIFPLYLCFLEEHGVEIPPFIKKAKGCPWRSRDLFYSAESAIEVEALRDWLFQSRSWQIRFMVLRCERVCEKMQEHLHSFEFDSIKKKFDLISRTPGGFYVLIDYLNFKGSGLAESERYQGQGWGLQQVLLKMDENTHFSPIKAFAEAAKELLTLRVQNSPPERHEQRWLKGWLSRLDTY